jgi:hypothetical protein
MAGESPNAADMPGRLVGQLSIPISHHVNGRDYCSYYHQTDTDSTKQDDGVNSADPCI